MIDTKKAKSPGCILLDTLFYILLDTFSPHCLILDLLECDSDSKNWQNSVLVQEEFLN